FGVIEYMGHTSAGTRSGLVDGPVTFVFTWTAPPPGDIPADNPNIVFCGVGNAANNDFSSSGDYIYSDSKTKGPNPVWNPPPTGSGDENTSPLPDKGGANDTDGTPVPVQGIVNEGKSGKVILY